MLDREFVWSARSFVRLLFVVFLACVLWRGPALAGTIDKTITVITEKGGVIGQKEASEKAIELASFELIDEFIGEAQRIKLAQVIERKVIRQSGKYVLVIRNLQSKPRDGGFEHNVQLKISTEGLEALLLQEGLLYRTEGAPRVLVMVSLSDRVNGQSLIWWQEGRESDSSGLLEIAQRLIRSLKSEMRPKGFFVMDPLSGYLRGVVPQGLRRENLNMEDLLFLARSVQAQLVVRGSILFQAAPGRADSYRINGRLTAIHANNGRIIGEVARVYQTETGPFRAMVAAKLADLEERMVADLASQIHDVWKSGVFGAGVLRVALKGEIPPKKLQEFKAGVLSQIRDLKNLKERLFESGRVVFEADTVLLSEQLAERLKKMKIPGLDLRIDLVDASGIEIRVNTTGRS